MGSGGSGMHTGSLSGPLETWQRAERLDVTRGAVSLVAAAPPPRMLARRPDPWAVLWVEGTCPCVSWCGFLASLALKTGCLSKPRQEGPDCYWVTMSANSSFKSQGRELSNPRCLPPICWPKGPELTAPWERGGHEKCSHLQS